MITTSHKRLACRMPEEAAPAETAKLTIDVVASSVDVQWSVRWHGLPRKRRYAPDSDPWVFCCCHLLPRMHTTRGSVGPVAKWFALPVDSLLPCALVSTVAARSPPPHSLVCRAMAQFVQGRRGHHPRTRRLWRREEFEDVARGHRGDVRRNRWRDQRIAMVSLPVSDGAAPSPAALADRVRGARAWLLNPERKRGVATETPTATRVRVSEPGSPAVVMRQSAYGLAWCEGLPPGHGGGAVPVGTALSTARVEPACPLQAGRITAGMHLASCVMRCVQVLLQSAPAEPAAREDDARVARVLLLAARFAAIGLAAAAGRGAWAAFGTAEHGGHAGTTAGVVAGGGSVGKVAPSAESGAEGSVAAAVISAAQDTSARRGVGARLRGGGDALVVSDSDSEGECGDGDGRAAARLPAEGACGGASAAATSSRAAAAVCFTPAPAHAATADAQGHPARVPESVAEPGRGVEVARGNAHELHSAGAEQGGEGVEGSEDEVEDMLADPIAYDRCAPCISHMNCNGAIRVCQFVGPSSGGPLRHSMTRHALAPQAIRYDAG